jgi:hypothetical protein
VNAGEKCPRAAKTSGATTERAISGRRGVIAEVAATLLVSRGQRYESYFMSGPQRWPGARREAGHRTTPRNDVAKQPQQTASLQRPRRSCAAVKEGLEIDQGSVTWV